MHDLIYFAETWIYRDYYFKIPFYFNDYTHIYSLAKKIEGLQGRASKGISLFVRKNEKLEILNHVITKTHIIIDIKNNVDKYRLAFFYWQPQLIYNDRYINELEEILHEMNLLDQDNFKSICFGDFNARIGLADNNFDEIIFENTNLFANRKSCDEEQNVRGIRLNSLMESRGFVVVNGRSPSDTPASYTYMSERGKSVIDLAYINSQAIEQMTDFQVVDFSTYSDHLICSLAMDSTIIDNYDHGGNYEESVQKVKWKPENLPIYINSIEKQTGIYFHSQDINELANNLSNTIINSLIESNMIIQIIPNRPKTFKSPWFNSKCLQARRDIARQYDLMKRNNYSNTSISNYTLAKKKYKALVNYT